MRIYMATHQMSKEERKKWYWERGGREKAREALRIYRLLGKGKETARKRYLRLKDELYRKHVERYSSPEGKKKLQEIRHRCYIKNKLKH